MANEAVKEPIEYPDADAILDRARRAECKSLFIELESLIVSIKTLEERVEEIKVTLEQFQYMVDGPGIRYGNHVYSSQQLEGRQTLDETLLMSAGVSKEVINDCYKIGKPYTRRTFRKEKTEDL